MLIRRNTKEFKTVKNIIENFAVDRNRKKNIKIYTVKSGHTIEDKISLEGANEVYYDMGYDTILNNLNNESMQLQKSDTENHLYYFHSTNNKNWDQSPFQLSDTLGKRFKEFENKTVKEKPQSSSPPLLSKKDHKKIKAKGDTRVISKKPVKPEKPKKPAAAPNAQKSEEKKTIIIENPYDLQHPIAFTNIDKIVFPELRITKKQLLDYYNNVADQILPYLKDRYVYFRWHRGSIRESNYSKSMESLKRDWKGNFPDWLTIESSYSTTYKEQRHYLTCKDKDHLMFLIEVGCVEISSWNSTRKNINCPDYAVIDLDPSELPFKSVAEVANIFKYILDHLKIPCFLKTSGNKGLHLYVPLDGKSDHEESRHFVEFICQLVHLKTPDLTSFEKSLENRKGKVYLNCTQNAYGKSVVAPFSIRPNAWAGIATPLEWKEVNEQLDLKEFNFINSAERIKRSGDPMAGMIGKGINAGKKLRELKDNYEFLL